MDQFEKLQIIQNNISFSTNYEQPDKKEKPSAALMMLVKAQFVKGALKNSDFLERESKKTKVLRIYSHFSVSVLVFKYIEVCHLVKRGTLWFLLLFVAANYGTSKLGKQLETNYLFSAACNERFVDESKKLEELIKSYFKETKLRRFRKYSLGKYWKEPMAYH